MKGGFAMNRMAATGMFLALALLGTLQGGSSFAADVVKDGASGDKMPQAMAADKAEKETVSACPVNRRDPEAEVKVPAVPKNKVFVTPQWVKSVMDGKQPESKHYVMLEVSWGDEAASPDYLREHPVGAIHMNTDWIEEGPIWNIRTPQEIEDVLTRLGITKDSTVILYSLDAAAPRVAWVCLWAGVENVKIMDGGLRAWKNSGYRTESKSNRATAVQSFGAKVPVHPEYNLTLEQAARKLAEDPNFRLVSIRSREEFEGKTSGYKYINKAGEPRGAVWGKLGKDAYSIDDYVHEDGTFITLAEAEKMWEGHGFTLDNELSFYCGTGWGAAIPWLILYENGIVASVYDGGWNEWQMHPKLPVQVGDPLSGKVEYTTVEELPNDKAVP